MNSAELEDSDLHLGFLLVCESIFAGKGVLSRQMRFSWRSEGEGGEEGWPVYNYSRARVTYRASCFTVKSPTKSPVLQASLNGMFVLNLADPFVYADQKRGGSAFALTSFPGYFKEKPWERGCETRSPMVQWTPAETISE